MKHHLIWIASVSWVAVVGCRGPNPSVVPAAPQGSPPPTRTVEQTHVQPQTAPPSPRAVAPAHAAVGKVLTSATPPNPEYQASGVTSLLDGRMGSNDYYDQEWMGWWYEDKPFEATIDLGESVAIQELGVHTLMASEAWIFYPRKVEFELSTDGKAYEKVATVTPDEAAFTSETADWPEATLLKASGLQRAARYVRVRVERLGELPKWHMAHGGADGYEGQAWLFIDEILVNPRQ